MNDLNPRQLDALRELDAAVYRGAVVKIETQFGEIGIRSAGRLGYAAELDPDKEFPEYSAYGATPSAALLNLRDELFRVELAKTSTVVVFPTRKCRVCLKSLRNGQKGAHLECSRSSNDKDGLEAA